MSMWRRPLHQYFAWTVIGIVGVFSIAYVLSQASQVEDVRVADGIQHGQPEDQEEVAGAESAMPEEDSLHHPVSIQALAQSELTGRDLTLGRVLENNAAYTRYFVTYKSGQLTISGIMNIPKGDGPFPVLFLNHGYIDPAVYTNGRGLKREQDYFARRGFAVLHSDYRNHADSDKDPDADIEFRLGYVEDVMNAVQAVKTSGIFSLDTERLGMLGHSMGGGVTLNIMVAKPDLVDAYVLYAPVSGEAEENFQRWTERRPEQAAEIRSRYGAPDESPEFWKNVSPINFLEQVTQPVLIQHGTGDDSVPHEWSERLHRLLVEKGKNVTFHSYPGGAHEFIAEWPTFMQRNAEFFESNLR